MGSPPPAQQDRKERSRPLSYAFLAAPAASLVLSLMFGFGAGTSCTNDGSNRSLSTAPCDNVSKSVTIAVAGNLIFLVAGLMLTSERRRRPWVPTATLIAVAVVNVVALVVGAQAFR